MFTNMFLSPFRTFVRSTYVILHLPSPSLTLQFLCSSQYKTLKVHLAAIQLHLEQGFSDPVSDELLHLMCDSYKMMEIVVPIALYCH